MSSAIQAAPPDVTISERAAGADALRWPREHAETVHGVIVPADVRAGDPVLAAVRLPGRSQRTVAAQVWRISPLGVELVRPDVLGKVGVGKALDLLLRVGRSTACFHSLPVVSTSIDRGRELLGMTWASPSPAARLADERRGAPRWACEGEYVPTGIAPSAARYGDYVYFRVVDISWTGMQLETSLRNKFVMPGVSFEATCTFPTQGQVQLGLQVVHARVVQRGQRAVLSVGARYRSQRRGRAREIIGQYLLQFGGGATVKDLCSAGFRIPASSRAFEFGSARNAEEYAEVLNLRRMAYVHAKKASADAKDLDMADGLDARSRILVAKHRGRIVGTMRMFYPDSDGDRLHHEDYVELPSTVPPRTELVELFKACTHPAFRGGDLFYALVRHAALTLVQSGRRYALMSATDSLAGVYERVGFRKTGTTYIHPSMGLRHHVMVADTRSVIEGKDISPIFWNLMDGYALWSFLRLGGRTSGRRWSAVRVQLWRLFHPLAMLARRFYSFGSRRATPPRSRPGPAERLLVGS